MITFKQFISESDTSNVKVDWKVSRPRMAPSDILRFLQSHCSGALRNYVKNNKVLWRGFREEIISPHTPIAIIDATDSQRKSLHSNNAYQVLFKMSPHLVHVPDRMSSIICSTRKETSSVYGNPRMVFPFDDCALAYNEGSDDVLYTGKMKIFGRYIEFSVLNRAAHILGDVTGVDAGKLKEIDPQILADIDERLKGASDEWVFIMLAAAMFDIAFGGAGVVKSKGLSTHMANVMHKLIDNNQAFTMQKPDRFNWFEDNIGSLKLADSLTPFGQSLFAWVKASKQKGIFQSFANELLLADESGMKVISPGDKLPDRTEIWFSGHALVITPLAMADVMQEYDNKAKSNEDV